MLNSVAYLGNYLLINLADDLDIQMKSTDLLKKAYTVLLIIENSFSGILSQFLWWGFVASQFQAN